MLVERVGFYLLVPRHQRLNLVGLDRYVSHEIEIIILTNDKIIFQSNAHVFIRDVNARFDSEHHPFGKWFVGRGDIVDIKSQVMRCSMHEVFFD